jgi:nucleotide-binding universal stress UspA family protein
LEEIVFDRDARRFHETIEPERQGIGRSGANRLKELDASAQVSFKNILLPTDFSKCSSAAMPYALSIARKYGSKLFVTHVTPYPLPAPRGSWDAGLDRAEKDAQRAMREVVAQLHGTPYEVLLRQGDVWSTLADLIEAYQIDLAVIGTHGHGGLTKAFLGSVAEQIFRQAPCPVLTVGPNVSTNAKSIAAIHRILYATDFTPDSLAAFHYAICLAEENQAQLSLLHVIESPKEEPSADLFAHRLYGLVPYRIGLLCRPTVLIRYGPAAEGILEAEHERGADLIVLGLKHADRFSAASTHIPWPKAHRIVGHAHCPVLTIRG